MIGIGVTSYRRNAHLELFIEQLEKHTRDYKLHVAIDDLDRAGIAAKKNECLRELKDCDYIFLFDDDCFPIKDGWVDFFIKHHLASEQHHFLYLKETATIKKTKEIEYLFHDNDDRAEWLDVYNNCGGAFMFLTKKVLEEVGGFCKDYGRYGYEHAGYSQRIHKAGLTTFGNYLSPQDANLYLYAMDYDNYLPFNKQVKHAPSLSNEISKLPEWIENNRKVFLKDIETIKQPI